MVQVLSHDPSPPHDVVLALMLPTLHSIHPLDVKRWHLNQSSCIMGEHRHDKVKLLGFLQSGFVGQLWVLRTGKWQRRDDE